MRRCGRGGSLPVVVVVDLAVEADMDMEEEGKGHVLGLRGARGVKACE